MNIHLQYGIVFLAVVVAGWSAWRKLRGRRVLGRGTNVASADGDGCTNCSSAAEHRHTR